MALSASTNLPHTVDRVTAVFVNEDFLRHTSELVGGTLESFAVDGDTAGAFSTTTVRTIPTTRMPDIARKFVGESLKVTQLEKLGRPRCRRLPAEQHHPEGLRRAAGRQRRPAPRLRRRQHPDRA